MTHDQEEPRVLASLFNFRDLGGTGTIDGRRVRPGLLYRSDGLTHVDADERTHLRDALGIRTIIDLRSPMEHAGLGRYEPDVFGVEVLELPVLDGAVMQAKAQAGHFDMATMYQHIAFDGAPQIARALGLLADAARLPAIVTCSGGKDRTGLVVAIALLALGVPAEAVLDDYQRSEAALAGLRERVTSRLGAHGVAVPPHVFELDRDAVAEVLDQIDDQSITTYLGVDGATIVATLRATLLEPDD
jgi:protein-tyrosine phosphatase